MLQNEYQVANVITEHPVSGFTIMPVTSWLVKVLQERNGKSAPFHFLLHLLQ